jgi:glycosyltransferase involved in cell wall biosynthesis
MNHVNKKNKILFITSFYSGISDSIINNTWNPKGMPAIYKLLEGLKKSDLKFDYCFINNKNQKSYKIKNINFPNVFFHILHVNQKSLPTPIKILQPYFLSKKKSKKIEESIDLSNYKLIYIDRANIDLIPYLERRFEGKIFLRLHGVSTLFQSYQNSLKFRLYNIHKLFSLRKKIDFILSSTDGTPVKKFLKFYTNKETKKKKIINGVNLVSSVVRKPDKIVRFLFVGRLENDKGIIQIIRAFNSLSNSYLCKCNLTIVGGGGLLEEVKKLSSGNPAIKVLSSIEHKKMEDIYLNSDVLISLNLLGNISNVVLEAINYELGIISLKKDDINNFDQESNEFLEDNAIYIDRHMIENQLKEKILFFVNDINNIDLYQQKTRDYLKTKLISWDERIQIELEIIKTLIPN